MSTWAEYEKARDALAEYTHHDMACHADTPSLSGPIPCTCGMWEARSALDAIVRAMAEDGERLDRMEAKRRVTAGFPTDVVGTLRWHDTDGPLRDAIDAVLPPAPRTQEASNAE